MIINTTEKYNLVKRAIAVRQLEAFANMKETNLNKDYNYYIILLNMKHSTHDQHEHV